MFFKSLIFIIFLIGPIILQIFLSKRENKWLGLILPMISGIYSVMVVLGLTVYSAKSIAETIVQLLVVFLLCNIPTVVLVAIYFACREKFKKKKEIDKMNIQDLD